MNLCEHDKPVQREAHKMQPISFLFYWILIIQCNDCTEHKMQLMERTSEMWQVMKIETIWKPKAGEEKKSIGLFPSRLKWAF